MNKNFVQRLEEELDETSDEMYQVTVSRKDLKTLIDSYKKLQTESESEFSDFIQASREQSALFAKNNPPTNNQEK